MCKNSITSAIAIMLIIFLCIGLVTSVPAPRVIPYDDNGLKDYDPVDKAAQENSVNANFPDDYGSIRIDKYETPKSQDYYIVDQVYIVHVKISGIGRFLDDISIIESVPSTLEIGSFKSCPVVVDPFDRCSINKICIISQDDSTKPISTWTGNYSYSPNNITLKISRLKPKHCIEYEYELIPRMTGTYSDITTVRIGGNSSKFPDAENKIEFDVRDPKFEIVFGKVDSYGYINSPLYATYNIVHESGSCSGQIDLNISFNNTTKCSIYYDKKSVEIVPFKSASVNVSIYYNEPGLQSFPPIIIDDIPHSLEENAITIYYYPIFKYATEFQTIFNSTSFMVMLYGILIYVLRGIDNEIKKLTDATNAANAKEGGKIIKYEIRYINIGEIVEDLNAPWWWKLDQYKKVK